MRRLFSTALFLLAAFAPQVASASQNYGGLFDVEARRAALQTPALASMKAACLAIAIDPKWKKIPVIAGLDETEGYGTDRTANDFNWAVMVLAGRSLAGDTAATEELKQFLLDWSSQHAFEKTQVVHDAYYSLKRVMLPTAVAYSILRPALSKAEDTQIRDWIDPLVRDVDQLFDGEVDLNNHRDLADSVLMVWGGIIGDDTLYQKGYQRFLEMLSVARPDGSLPLETRRGARALWYTRQALSSMVVMAEVARGHGDDLYSQQHGNVSFWTIFSFLLNGLSNPVLVDAYAAQNYIPGPVDDYRHLDFGFLERRSNGRNYLASMEALAIQPPTSFALQRIDQMFDTYALGQRPLIDEFVGGNATCFWGAPKS
ncbi:MAG TPA: alginate lyase family protein [Devosiaceae bacterium]|jgi:poly(beta-D-mannuronate) lyase